LKALHKTRIGLNSSLEQQMGIVGIGVQS